MKTLVDYDELIHFLKSDLPQEELDRGTQNFLDHPMFKSVMLYSNQSVRVVEHTNFKYLYVSDTVGNLVGWSREEFTRGGLLWTYRKIHPLDLFSLANMLRKIYKAVGKMENTEKLNSRFKYDVRFLCKDGTYRRILQYCYVLSLDPRNKPAILLFISSDISEIKRSTKIEYELSTYYPDKGFVTILESQENVSEDVPLSLRELEILKLITDGLSDNQVGDRLFISPHTVRTHRKNILRKVDVRNTPELVRRAFEHGWI